MRSVTTAARIASRFVLADDANSGRRSGSRRRPRRIYCQAVLPQIRHHKRPALPAKPRFLGILLDITNPTPHLARRSKKHFPALPAPRARMLAAGAPKRRERMKSRVVQRSRTGPLQAGDNLVAVELVACDD